MRARKSSFIFLIVRVTAEVHYALFIDRKITIYYDCSFKLNEFAAPKKSGLATLPASLLVYDVRYYFALHFCILFLQTRPYLSCSCLLSAISHQSLELIVPPC